MNYIKNLRRSVGSQPIIMVGAAILVLDQAERLLLLKRTDNGAWCLPGGAMELGESLEDTARRELLEETGLKVNELRLLKLFSGEEMFYEYPHGDQVFNVTAVYLVQIERASIQLNSSEHTEHQFVDLDALPDLLNSPDQHILDQLTQQSF